MSGAFTFGGGHSCGDSRLTCVDCSGPLCPKCMVQCPVGNRCPKCAGKFTSHVFAISPMLLLRTLAASGVVGYAFGFLHGFSMGFYGFIILYAVGVLIGNVLHRIAGYKMGPKIIATIVIGIVGGSAFSPMFANHARPSRALSQQMAGYMVGAEGGDYDSALQVAATRQAQLQWQQFQDAYEAKIGGDYRVKVPVTQGKVTDSVWLNVERIKDDQVTGKVVTEPVKLPGVKKDDSVTVKKSEVLDWAYKNGSASVGGFTFNAMMAKNNLDAMDSTLGAGLMVSGLISLALFLAGVLTPVTGIMPPIRLPWIRY